MSRGLEKGTPRIEAWKAELPKPILLSTLRSPSPTRRETDLLDCTSESDDALLNSESEEREEERDTGQSVTLPNDPLLWTPREMSGGILSEGLR